MVIRTLSILCFLLYDLMNLLWVFTISWASCSRASIFLSVGFKLVVDVLGLDTQLVVEVDCCYQFSRDRAQLYPFLFLE